MPQLFPPEALPRPTEVSQNSKMASQPASDARFLSHPHLPPTIARFRSPLP